jgi:putative drug exporter of the RND superfamily
MRKRLSIQTETLARASARHPWRTIACWLVVVIASLAATGAFLSTSLVGESDMTNKPEAIRAKALIDARLPQQHDTDEVVIVRSATATVDDPGFRALVTRVRGEIQKTGAVESVGKPSLVSKDRHATLLPVVMGRNPETGIDRVVAVVQRADGRNGAAVKITGTWTAGRDFMTVAQRDLKRGELNLGLPAALIVLALVFGALVAAFVPIAVALVAILVAVGLTALIGQLAQLNVFVLNMITAMGLALGIDYTLFVLSRFREERGAGRGRDAAIAVAGATASRAVLFSGTAFVLAMIGMIIVPDATLRSLAIGAILVGAVTVVAALTLLPAILRLIGHRVNALRIPFVGRRLKAAGNDEGRFWTWVAGRVTRRPLASVLVTAAVLLAAASPVLDLKTGFPSLSTLAGDLPSKQGFVALQGNFGESITEPVSIAIDGDVTAPGVRAGIARLDGFLRSDRGFGPASTRLVPKRSFALVSVPLAGDSLGSGAYGAIDRLRRDYVPRSFPNGEATALVGGETAHHADSLALVDHWLPIVITAVLAVTFVLLTTVFRSVVLALQAVVFNLLSVGAAYGLIVLVFVKGVGNELFGFQQIDSVVAWIPLFLFSVLFGLSMDYNVFLLSRIRERYQATGDHTAAITFGIGSTARLITGAALIIVAVWAGFALSDLVEFQQVGFGIAVALIIDATIVRSVLVPASMALLGERTWWLPRRLAWLPQIGGERVPSRPFASTALAPEGGR